MKLALLGASGRVGRQIIEEALQRGHGLRCQTRDASRLGAVQERVEVQAFDPRNEHSLVDFVDGCDGVILALGTDSRAPTTLFSDVTRALLSAMEAAGVRRLIAITGVGAGETRGHGGFLYDRVIFPLFTRNRYRDKDLQEALIEASELEWTIVRPAPFARRVPDKGLEVMTRIHPHVRLRRITVQEVASFVVDQVQDPRYLRRKPFIGHS